jgi:hypothetical protein
MIRRQEQPDKADCKRVNEQQICLRLYRTSTRYRVHSPLPITLALPCKSPHKKYGEGGFGDEVEIRKLAPYRTATCGIESFIIPITPPFGSDIEKPWRNKPPNLSPSRIPSSYLPTYFDNAVPESTKDLVPELSAVSCGFASSLKISSAAVAAPS